MTPATIQAEVMLLDWSTSRRGGSKLILAISDDELEFFKMLTFKDGNRAGQRMMMVCVPLADDDQPVALNVAPAQDPVGTPTTPSVADSPAAAEKPARRGHYPDGLCGLAVRWSTDPKIVDDFVSWLWDADGENVYNANEKLPDGAGSSDLASAAIREICHVESRKALDMDKAAGKIFRDRILHPYGASRKARGLDA